MMRLGAIVCQSRKFVGLVSHLKLMLQLFPDSRFPRAASRLETHAGLLCCSLEVQFLLLLETCLFS